jgi:ArsR family transcriptional regulator
MVLYRRGDTMNAIKYLKTISNSTKLRLVSLLIESELCVCEMEEVLDIRQVNISKNLNSLKEAGIVDVRREKQRAFYFLSNDFLTNEHLVNHVRDLKMKEPQLIKDYKMFLKHEEVKDQTVYVCNIFRNEAS